MKRIMSLFLAFSMLISLIGCDNSEEISDISFFVSSLPKSLDPQIVSTKEEKCLVTNIFEGLTRIKSDGKVALAAAESYTLSADGLVYTFKLYDNKLWSDSTPLTAYDFEFGIKRSADPQTKSNDTVRISSIKGADEILSGAASVDTLGVKALDKDTLEITLKEPCPQFLSYLAEPAFMPCNQEYFNNTNGKYGRDRKNILTNGVYSLNGWKPEKNYISIRYNKNYVGNFGYSFDSVIFQTAGSDTLVTDFSQDKIHLIAANGEITPEKFTEASVLEIANKTVALYISKSFATENMLNALKLSVDTQSICNSTNSYSATGYIPKTADFGGNLYAYLSTIPIYNHVYNPELAYDTYISEINSKEYKGSLPSVSLLYTNDGDMEIIAKKIAAGWQSDLGAFVNVKCVSFDELNTAINNDDFGFALVPFSAESNTAENYMLSVANSSVQIGEGTFFKDLVNSIAHSKNDKEYADRILAAEKMLIETDNIIPICHTTEKYICNTSIYNRLRFVGGVFDFTIPQ